MRNVRQRFCHFKTKRRIRIEAKLQQTRPTAFIDAKTECSHLHLSRQALSSSAAFPATVTTLSPASSARRILGLVRYCRKSKHSGPAKMENDTTIGLTTAQSS